MLHPECVHSLPLDSQKTDSKNKNENQKSKCIHWMGEPRVHFNRVFLAKGVSTNTRDSHVHVSAITLAMM
jgi:hypothetical protein